ncbi:phospholipase D-like domain-containing protein [Acinetobacter sp. ANC 5383]
MLTDNQIKTKAYFEEIDHYLIQEVYNAEESILICVAWINWEAFTPIFNELSEKNIKIEIIYFDDHINKKKFIKPNDEVITLAVKPRSNKYMHNKFCIVDNESIITGSFNWSKQAKLHFENMVIIKNDWELVKSYLHEFNDIKDFYNYKNKDKIKCESNKCRKGSYNLAILGSEYGQYDESKIEIWNICLSKDTGIKLNDEYVQFLHTHLGINDDSNDQDYEDDSNKKITMLNSFNQEREKTSDTHDYFKTSFNKPINAIGRVVMTNYNEHHKFDQDPEYIIKIIWRDMFFRKLIPTKIHDDDYGFANTIINNHTY